MVTQHDKSIKTFNNNPKAFLYVLGQLDNLLEKLIKIYFLINTVSTT
jgi:hypothetical protein